MTHAELKKYLSSIRSSGQTVPQINDIVDNAIKAGFGYVWGAYSWKVKRREDISLSATSGQPHTILNSGMESLVSLVLEDGTSSRWINIMGEENFDMSYPRPASHTNSKPIFAKLVKHSEAGNDVWRVYWFPVPNSSYGLRLVYDMVGSPTQLPNVPSYMLAAIVDKCVELVLPPGENRMAQMQIAEGSLKRAINADTAVSGAPKMLGSDPGWNQGAFVGQGRDDIPDIRAPWWPGWW